MITPFLQRAIVTPGFLGVFVFNHMTVTGGGAIGVGNDAFIKDIVICMRPSTFSSNSLYEVSFTPLIGAGTDIARGVINPSGTVVHHLDVPLDAGESILITNNSSLNSSPLEVHISGYK